MSAKEELRRRIENLTESEAEDALDYLERRHGERDPLLDLLEDAPDDDEPADADEERGVDEAWAEHERGEVASLEEIRRRLG